MRRDDTGSGLACRAALPPRGGKGGEEREDGRDSGTETRGSRRGRAVHGNGPKAGCRKRRRTQGKKKYWGHSREEGMQREGIASAAFWVFIIYYLISRHLAECHWNALDCFTVANSFNIL